MKSLGLCLATLSTYI